MSDWFEPTTATPGSQSHLLCRHRWIPLLHLTANHWLVVEGKPGSPPVFPWQCRDCDQMQWLSAEQAMDAGLVALMSLTAPVV